MGDILKEVGKQVCGAGEKLGLPGEIPSHEQGAWRVSEDGGGRVGSRCGQRGLRMESQGTEVGR